MTCKFIIMFQKIIQKLLLLVLHLFHDADMPEEGKQLSEVKKLWNSQA